MACQFDFPFQNSQGFVCFSALEVKWNQDMWRWRGLQRATASLSQKQPESGHRMGGPLFTEISLLSFSQGINSAHLQCWGGKCSPFSCMYAQGLGRLCPGLVPGAVCPAVELLRGVTLEFHPLFCEESMSLGLQQCLKFTVL